MPRRGGVAFGARNLGNTDWVAQIVKAEAEAELAAATARTPPGQSLDMDAFLAAMARRVALALYRDVGSA